MIYKQAPVRVATTEDYLVYKAYKEGIALEGCRTVDQQFNSIAKVGGIHEAVDLVLEDMKVDTLVHALMDLQLDGRVKTDLKWCVVSSLVELGRTEKWVGSGWTRGKDVKYGLTEALYEKTREYGRGIYPEFGEELAEFLLYDKHSPLAQYEVGWELSSEHVRAAIDVLRRSGKAPDTIIEYLIRGIRGKQGAFHTIQRYVTGISDNREMIIKGGMGYRLFGGSMLAEAHKQVYTELFRRLPEVITPNTIEGAIRQIKLSQEEYSKELPHTGEAYYANLVMLKVYAESGKLEEDVRTGQYDPRAWAENHVSPRFNEYKETQLRPLTRVLDDFEAELGTEQFTTKGYAKARDNVLALQSESEQAHQAIIEAVNALQSRHEAEQKTEHAAKQSQKPWYLRLFSSR